MPLAWCASLLTPFFGRAGAVLMGSDNGALDHRIFVVGIGGQAFEHALPNPVFGPAAEPPMGILPAAGALGQVAPPNSRAIPIEDRFDKAPIVLGGCADISQLPWEQVLDPLPLIVAQSIPSWVSPVRSRPSMIHINCRCGRLVLLPLLLTYTRFADLR